MEMDGTGWRWVHGLVIPIEFCNPADTAPASSSMNYSRVASLKPQLEKQLTNVYFLNFSQGMY